MGFKAEDFCISSRHLGMSARDFTGPPHRLQFYSLLFIFKFISVGPKAGNFCISSRHPCLSAQHFFTSPPRRILFHYFTIFNVISIGFKARSFCVSSRNPCMSALDFCNPRAANPLASPRYFVHHGPPTLHVGSRFCMSAKRIPSASGRMSSEWRAGG